MKEDKKIRIIFLHRKLTLKVRILAFSKTFTQLTSRIKHFLVGWLLFWGLNVGLVECAIVYVKSWVILIHYDPLMMPRASQVFSSLLKKLDMYTPTFCSQMALFNIYCNIKAFHKLKPSILSKSKQFLFSIFDRNQQKIGESSTKIYCTKNITIKEFFRL